MFKKRPLLLSPEGDAAPAAPAAAPTAAAPATPANPAPSTEEGTQVAAAPKPDGSIIANTEAKPDAKPEGEAKPDAFDPVAAKAFLTEKGQKAEDLDKLSPEDLQKKYDEIKALPDPVDYKLPDGIQMNDDQAKAFKDVMADTKLSPSERAQKLIDMHGEALKQAAQAPYDLWNTTQAEWQTTVKADKELGGQNYDNVRATIAKAVTAVGGPEAAKIFEAFQFTGAGNNPEIVRIMYRLSAAHVEGGHVGGSAPGSAGDKTAATLQSMYPSASKAR